MSDHGKDLCVDCKDYDRCGENHRPCEIQAACKHWFNIKKHPCGPATTICQDCGREEAL